MMRRSLPSLRSLLALTFGAVAMLAATSAALFGGSEAARRIVARDAEGREGMARQLAALLVQGVAMRVDQLRAAAALPPIRDPTTTPAERQATLLALSQAFPDLAMLVLLGPDNGAVSRPAPAAGRATLVPAVTAVRETPQRVASADPANAGYANVGRANAGPLSVAVANAAPASHVVTLAWPVRGPDATLNGVLSAELSWDWARAVVERFGTTASGAAMVEMLVIARDGQVLLGPPDLEGTIIADPAGLGPWPDGRRYLVGMAEAAGWGALPDPGWRVIARQPADIALVPVRELKQRVAAGATIAALLAAALGWLLARAIAQPGEALAAAARQAGAGAGVFRSDPGAAWYREARDVAIALRDLVNGLRRIAARRAEAEAALRDLNQTLERRIAERTRALEAANLRLAAAERLETIGKLTGGVAHDINNLLQVLESGLALLSSGGSEAKRRDVEATMGKAVARGARLTRQLLAFARQQPLTPQAIDLTCHLIDLGGLLAQSLRTDIGLEIVVAQGTWPVMVDRTQLDVALINLAVNARDAMPTGGTLRIVAENVEVDGPPLSPASDEPAAADEEFSGALVRITVSDTGTGMPPEVLARAFEPFYTTKDASRGSGLGLSQVWGFARQSGGTAHMDSVPGVGTHVVLELPRALAQVPPCAIAPAHPGEAMPVPPALEGDGRMLSVLLVEDDPDVAELLMEVLESFGHHVRHVPTGAAALEALGDSYRPDVVLTDIMMPGGVSGLALVQELRIRTPGLPVVLATGYSDKAAEVQRAGLPVLRKPFRASELAAVLEQVTKGLPRGNPSPPG
jgi:signal transduction histidine kinase/CheY-like chemotaxis protein